MVYSRSNAGRTRKPGEKFVRNSLSIAGLHVYALDYNSEQRDSEAVN